MAIPYFLLGLALLVGMLLLLRWYVGAEPRQVLRVARWVLVFLAIALGLALLFAGRHALALFALPALIPILMRWRMLARRLKAARGPTPGQRSEVATRFLRMWLDHDSGEMSGEVLEGAFAGRQLARMTLAELIELWRECHAADEESAAILEADLDRTEGEAWREAAGAAAGEGAAGDGGARSGMTREEAYQILGLEPGASEKEVRAAHHRLMQKIHPDHGGSNYLAAKINQAKDLLLGA